MSEARILNGSNWRQHLPNQWNITVLDRLDFPLKSYLWTTRCSKTKAIARGVPRQMYVSAANLFFYRFAEQQGLRYGILSDKYGLHLDDECQAYYDIHPETLSLADKIKLGQAIARKALQAGYRNLVFYNASPLMSKPYFEMLAHTELNVYFTTRLRV